MAHNRLDRLAGDIVSDWAGRSGQEAKRRRAGRLRKEGKDIDQYIKQLEMEDRVETRRINRLFGPRRPPRRSK